MKRRGEKPKDYLRDYKQKLRDTQKENQVKKIEAEVAKPKPFKLKQFETVPSAVTQKLQTAEAVPGHEFLRKQSSRTLMPSSPGTTVIETSLPVSRKPAVPRLSHLPSAAAPVEKEEKNYVKKNLLSAVLAKPPPTPAEAPEPTPTDAFRTNKNFGKVPSYLIKKKQADLDAREKADELQRLRDENVEGMMLLPDTERLSVLQSLMTRRSELGEKLARFPMMVDTDALKRHKGQLEKAIEENERGISKFSRQRVYVAL
eukprot:TRINITY_DN5798_c3_g1_i1.p1 TRINITY_DN5798_c3_g1~~TRINITY_DN5798_c3_g1_i1.p1  ORF type:complete len:287 (-),score=67.76 TRINITY_DN5798_c3_g1_i1:294-1067(-)